MRKLLVFSAFLVGFSPAGSFAQAVSGGQAPQAGTEVRANPYNSNNAVDQYLQQRQINNLPVDQKRTNTSATNLGPARPAKPSELTAGATVNDNAGQAMAKIEQVDADGVVVSLGAAKVKIPADAFGHNKAGLLLDMTRAQFEQIVARANAAS